MSSGLGKVILVGEHAVVYGHPAVAGAIDLRVRARIVGRADVLSVSCQSWELSAAVGDGSAPGRALEAMARGVGFDAPVHIEVQTQLPARAGLGSSAALCVALTRCLAEARVAAPESAEIEHIAGLGEEAFHDNPSGVDVALATRGGVGVFRKGRGLERIAARPLQLAVGLTGEPRQTAAMVAEVARRREADRPGVDSLLQTLGTLSERAVDELARGGDLGPLLSRAHELLVALGLSSPGIDRLVELAHSAGATGAKLTGAGGGGAVIAVAEPGGLGEIIRAWKQAGYQTFTPTVGARP